MLKSPRRSIQEIRRKSNLVFASTSGGSPVPGDGDKLLLETGDRMLQETGFFILLDPDFYLMESGDELLNEDGNNYVLDN